MIGTMRTALRLDANAFSNAVNGDAFLEMQRQLPGI